MQISQSYTHFHSLITVFHLYLSKEILSEYKYTLSTQNLQSGTQICFIQR